MRDCIECRQCNRKGKPSVTKYSMFCDTHFIGIKKTTKSIIFRKILIRLKTLTELKDNMLNRRFDEKKGLNSKGFRKRWFE